jgi:hypothetical protein
MIEGSGAGTGSVPLTNGSGFRSPQTYKSRSATLLSAYDGMTSERVLNALRQNYTDSC